MRESECGECGKARLAHGAAHVANEVEMQQRRFALLDQDAARSEHASAVGVEGGVEQAGGGTDGVGAVDDDHVDAGIGCLLHPFDAVREQELGARIGGTGIKFREPGFGHACDAFVDLDLDGRDNIVVM